MKKVCVFLFAVTAMHVLSEGYAQCALPGYTYVGKYNGHAYYTADRHSSWAEAQAAAVTLGGHLAVINDEDENLWLADALAGRRAWIGLTDVAAEGAFTWSNGEPVTFTNWAAGEPNNEDHEDYAEINRFGLGQWNDMPARANYLPGVVEFGDADCDGVSDACDRCNGGDDNGPCAATVFPGLGQIPDDWICSPGGDKISVCHNGVTICTSLDVVQAHLRHGDLLGPCSSCDGSGPMNMTRVLSVSVYPNPGDRQVSISLRGIDAEASLGISDLWGREVYRKRIVADEYILSLSLDRFGPGDHYVRVTSNDQTVVRKFDIPQ